MNAKLKKIKPVLIKILKAHDVAKAGVFGSYARGKQKKNSDIDVLIKTKKGMSLLGFSHLKVELEEALKRRVDLVEYDTIKPLIRKRILSEEIKIL